MDVKEMILELCEGKGWDWKAHIESVVKHAKVLAKELGADEEVCELAAWLHDIRKLKGEFEEHHVTGAEDAVQILEGSLEPERLARVKECILTQSSDKRYQPVSTEAKIVASADALSHFDNVPLIAYTAYAKKGLSVEEGRQWMLRKYASCWEKLLLPEARAIAKPRYEMLRALLDRHPSSGPSTGRGRRQHTSRGSTGSSAGADSRVADTSLRSEGRPASHTTRPRPD